VTALAYPPKPEQPQQDPTKPGGIPLPPDIKDRLTRGRQAMKKDANLRRLCHKFWLGEHYWYQTVSGALNVLATALIDVTGGKPGHRVRNTYNFIASIVEGKVSASTGTTPGYEIDPSSADLEDVAAARIAEQVAYYGYDKWYSAPGADEGVHDGVRAARGVRDAVLRRGHRPIPARPGRQRARPRRDPGADPVALRGHVGAGRRLPRVALARH
jgi:hypothetical protein